MKYTHVKSAMVAVAALALAFVSVPQSAFALTSSANIAVSTTVTNNCTISATGLAFTAYSASSTTADTGSATLTINCTKYADYTVALDKGQGTGATVTTRQMTNNGYTLGYSLYTSSAYGTVWGDGTSSSVTQTGVGTGANQTLTVYGQIPINEPAVSGTYNDTIAATITY